ncbi:MAG: type II toxin-antitoxin system RelE/ParE family toxin [Kiritimatiellae bacterium]|jgi:mRNA interferase RelE/StbE|nr:type II toxin-antitoxin system RelE/ParE family toxin [Kiritimatiellia bacterium]
MTYKLKFLPRAWKEWKKLEPSLQNQFIKKLEGILTIPHVQGDALRGAVNAYKIKLRQSGYRLVYVVEDRVITIYVVGIGKREKDEVYRKALRRWPSGESKNL